MSAVSNSTPLIYLASVGDLDFIRKLFGRILIPRAVYDEVVTAGKGKPGVDAVDDASKSWLGVESVRNRKGVEHLVDVAGLDLGEAEAIVLTQESGERTILIDDQAAVQAARSAGLEVIRTAALYVIAKNNRLIEQVKPRLDVLRAAGFWLREEHYRAILQRAGEL